MLKITSRQERLNRRMAQKETTRLLHKLFHCFFVSPNTSKNSRKTPLQKHFHQIQIPSLSQHSMVLGHLKPYFLHWQSKLLFRHSFTKARTICFLTGRSRSVYRAFHLSRLKIREYGAMGYFTGLSKASW